jgi:hypothetical protein
MYMTRGELDRADAMLKRALILSEELGFKEGKAAAATNLGLISQRRGEAARACQRLAQGRDLFREIGSATAAQVEGWMRDVGCPEG